MSYPSSLKDEQWAKISTFFEIGNQAVHDKRDLTNAVLYLTKTGCQWRQMPKDFPPWPTVQSFFRRAKEKGLWEKILKALVEEERERRGRKPGPTYGVVDSQSVKTTGPSTNRGIDGGKKNKRSKTAYCNGHTR
jgi:transposase